MNSKIVSIIFSKDRALQLQACLDSFFLNSKDSENTDIVVLCKTSSISYFRQYQVLKERFKKVAFVEEVKIVEQLIEITKKYTYVLLQVDDTLFTNPFLLSEVVTTLQENEDAIGFSLRLGLNTIYCYNLKGSNQRIPDFSCINDKIIKYVWSKGQFDFAYPLEVSSSVYRVKDVMPIWLEHTNIDMPHIEDTMNKSRGKFVDTFPHLLCYKRSVAFSNPMNAVSVLPENWNIPVWGDKRFSVDALMKAFDLGYKIDVTKFLGFVSNGCHQEVELEFTK